MSLLGVDCKWILVLVVQGRGYFKKYRNTLSVLPFVFKRKIILTSTIIFYMNTNNKNYIFY